MGFWKRQYRVLDSNLFGILPGGVDPGVYERGNNRDYLLGRENATPVEDTKRSVQVPDLPSGDRVENVSRNVAIGLAALAALVVFR